MHGIITASGISSYDSVIRLNKLKLITFVGSDK